MEYYAVSKHGNKCRCVYHVGLFLFTTFSSYISQKIIFLVTLMIESFSSYTARPHRNGMDLIFYLVFSEVHSLVSSLYGALWCCLSPSVASIFLCPTHIQVLRRGYKHILQDWSAVTRQPLPWIQNLMTSGKIPCVPFFWKWAVTLAASYRSNL